MNSDAELHQNHPGQRQGHEAPLISIITVCFNAARFIQQTIDSVAGQEFRCYEYIVVDGGSTDGTVEILERNTKNLSSWLSEPDQGIADAMNKGAGLATGTYLYFLNADDYLIDRAALSRVAPLLATNPDVLSCPVQFRTGQGSEIKRAHGFSFWANFKQSVMHQGTFCTRALFHRLGGFDTRFCICMDFDFFLRAKIAGATLEKADNPLAVMRDTGISSQRDWPAIKIRLLEEKKSHFLNRADFLWRMIYGIYWPVYWTYKRVRTSI